VTARSNLTFGAGVAPRVPRTLAGAARAVAALSPSRGTCAVAAPPASRVWARVTSLKVSPRRPERVTKCV